MKPNIFFVTVDSLRADRCFGENRSAKTPNLDSLIKKGIYFSQAISAADQTGASLSSVFSGIFPINLLYDSLFDVVIVKSLHIDSQLE